ncbi:MAG: NUDIX domain-containing protein [Nanoarchaeota archaeon]|nr:NUDIX domain-containing protein [Nanoarchaeota archaeon]
MENFKGVIGIIFIRETPIKYVLINNQSTGNITFPAGAREGNETSKQTLEREIKEETGLLPNKYKIIKTPVVHELVYNAKKKERVGQKVRQKVYLIETDKKELTPEDTDSIIEGWYDEDHVLEKLTFDDSKGLFLKAIKYI